MIGLILGIVLGSGLVIILAWLHEGLAGGESE